MFTEKEINEHENTTEFIKATTIQGLNLITSTKKVDSSLAVLFSAFQIGNEDGYPLREFLYPNYYFIFDCNRVYFVLHKLSLKYDQPYQILLDYLILSDNQEDVISSLKKIYLGSKANDSALSKSFECLLTHFHKVLKHQSESNYYYQLKHLSFDSKISSTMYEKLLFPSRCFKLISDSLYYCAYGACYPVDHNLLCDFFKIDPSLSKNFEPIKKFYDSLYSIIVGDSSYIETESEYLRLPYTDSDGVFLKSRYCYELHSFELNAEGKVPNGTEDVLQNIRLSSRAKMLISELSDKNINNLKNFAEFFARIFTTKHISGYLWILVGDNNLKSFADFLHGLLLDRVSFADLTKACKVRATKDLLNTQTLGTCLIYTENGSLMLERTKSRLASMVRGEPIRGIRGCDLSNGHRINLAFAYATYQHNLSAVKSKLYCVPTKVITIPNVDYSKYSTSEQLQAACNLTLLGMKNIVEKERESFAEDDCADTSLSDFIKDCCNLCELNTYTESLAFYVAYKSYCLTNNFQPLGRYKAMEQLQEQYNSIEYKSCRRENNRKVIWGISLKSDIKLQQPPEDIKQESFEDTLDKIFTFNFFDPDNNQYTAQPK